MEAVSEGLLLRAANAHVSGRNYADFKARVREVARILLFACGAVNEGARGLETAGRLGRKLALLSPVFRVLQGFFPESIFPA